jgi:SAM-dependent methyltransferase
LNGASARFTGHTMGTALRGPGKFGTLRAPMAQPGNSKERFSGRVDDYVRYRPRYPHELVPLLQREIGLEPEWRIADIGSGTGLSAEPFLRNGNVVWGVEPNAEMRAAAERVLAEWPGFVSVAGSAENSSLPGDSVDLVVAGQAFHWFDRESARAEFRRILRPHGWVVLVWNNRSQASPFLRAYETLLEQFGTDYQEVRHDRLRQPVIEAFFGQAVQHHVMPCTQTFDFEGVRGRLLSSSYTPPADDPRRQPMIAELHRIFDRYQQDGQVLFQYETQVYFGRLPETDAAASRP